MAAGHGGPAPASSAGPAHRPPASFTDPGPRFAETHATGRAGVRNFHS